MFSLRSLRIFGIAIIVILGTISSCIAQEGRAGITPSQKEQLKNLAVETKSKTTSERSNLRRARIELFQVYKSYNIDEQKAKAALAKISSAQAALLDIHLQNQIELRRILNEDQFNLFRKRMERFRDHNSRAMSQLDSNLDKLPDRQMLKNAGVNREQLRKAAAILTPKQVRIKVIEKLRRSSMQIMGLYRKYNLDTQTAKKLIQDIHDNQSELADLNHKKQQALRNVLTESQFIKVRNQIEKKMREGIPTGGSRKIGSGWDKSVV